MKAARDPNGAAASGLRHWPDFDSDVAAWHAALAERRAGRRSNFGGLAARLTAFVRGEVDPAVSAWLRLDGRTRQSELHDAADLLNELGIWDGHEDLALWRSDLLRPWPSAALASVRATPDLPAEAPRLEWPFVAMDNDAPHEVDDALYLETTPAGPRLHVAIAHPTAWLPADSPADLEARRRGATLYHPRHVVGMLPDALARDAASLQVGVWRPALVVSVTLDAAGMPHAESLQEAWVRVQHAWSYSQVARALAGAEVSGVDRAQLDALIAFGLAAEAARIRNGAWLLYRPDVELTAPPFAPVAVLQVQQTSPGRRLVTEAMVQACAAIGQLGKRHHLALPYRTQPRPSQPPLPPGLYDDPAQCFRMFRVLEAGATQPTPGAHGMMAVPAYVQFSSPLRRYTDLIAHRQLTAWLRGQPLPHTAKEIADHVSTAEEGARERRQVQRKAAHYFKLLKLAGQPPERRLAGQVVRVLAAGDRSVFIPELALEAPLRSPTLGVGDHVELTVREVNPARGTLELGLVGR